MILSGAGSTEASVSSSFLLFLCMFSAPGVGVMLPQSGSWPRSDLVEVGVVASSELVIGNVVVVVADCVVLKFSNN